MTTSFYTIDILLDKVLAEEPMTDMETAVFGEWLSRSDKHRALPGRFRDQQEVGQGLRELRVLSMRASLASILAGVSALPAPRIWRWKAVAAAAVFCIFSTLVARIDFSSSFSSNEPTIASITGTEGARRQRTAANAMTFTDGNRLMLDRQPNGAITGDSAFGSIKKTNNTIAYTYLKDTRTGRLMNEVSTDSGKGLIILLADGSKVWLKGMSRIGALPSADSTTRVLSLTGEASFEVAPHSGQAFIVYAGGMRVSVLGTVFSIKAYPDAKSHIVTLVRGKVQVDSGGRSVTLDTVKNNVAEVSGSGIDVRRERYSDSLLSLRTKLSPLRIKNDELETAVRKVAGLYGMKVVNPQHVRGISVHGTFYPEKDVHDNIEDIRKVVGGKIWFDIKGDTIRILRTKS